MNQAPSSTYLKTRVMTASPEELRLMLLEGAIRFANQAADGLDQKNYEKVYVGMTKCQNVLIELLSGLRPDHDPELCNRLSGLYTFLINRMMEGGHRRDRAIVAEVIKLLEYERETWIMLMRKLVEERNGAAEDDAENHAREPGSGARRPDGGDAAGGRISLRG